MKFQNLHQILNDKAINLFYNIEKISINKLEKIENLLRKNNFPVIKNCENSPLTLSLGGDGTLITAVKNFYPFCKNFLGINFGKIGFLTNPESILENLNQEFYLSRRYFIQSSFDNKLALNEFVIRSKDLGRTVSCKVFIDGVEVFTVNGDGLIISSATGSTAYCLAAGGSIIHPETRTIQIIALAHHSLASIKSIVLERFNKLEVLPLQEAFLIIDGQQKFTLQSEKKLTFFINEKNYINILFEKNYNFFKTVREKLIK